MTVSTSTTIIFGIIKRPNSCQQVANRDVLVSACGSDAYSTYVLAFAFTLLVAGKLWKDTPWRSMSLISGWLQLAS